MSFKKCRSGSHDLCEIGAKFNMEFFRVLSARLKILPPGLSFECSWGLQVGGKGIVINLCLSGKFEVDGFSISFEYETIACILDGFSCLCRLSIS